MESPTTSRFRWFYIIFCLIGVIALVLIVKHQADEDLHSTDPQVQLPKDAESGAKKFDHLEFFNTSTADLISVEIKLIQPQVLPDVLPGPIANGHFTLTGVPSKASHHWVLGHVGTQQDYVAMAECIVTLQVTVNGNQVTQTHTCRIEAEAALSLRSATFWFGHPPALDGKPIENQLNLCGEGLSEMLEAGGNSRVLGHTELQVQ